MTLVVQFFWNTVYIRNRRSPAILQMNWLETAHVHFKDACCEFVGKIELRTERLAKTGRQTSRKTITWFVYVARMDGNRIPRQAML